MGEIWVTPSGFISPDAEPLISFTVLSIIRQAYVTTETLSIWVSFCSYINGFITGDSLTGKRILILRRGIE